MLKSKFIAISFIFSVAASAHAQTNGQHVLEAMFYNFDENRDGVITLAEANHFIDATFKEMDMRHSGKITREAFRSFSFGLADVAAEQGVTAAYERAKDSVFDRWDRSHANALTVEDYRAGVLGDARVAVGGKETDKDLRLDMAAFMRLRFVHQLMVSLH